MLNKKLPNIFLVLSFLNLRKKYLKEEQENKLTKTIT
jgi:hypothetical protein